MGLWVVGGPAGAMLLARGLPNPALLVTNPPAGRDVAEDMADTQSLVGRLASGEVILGDGSYIMTLEKRGYATAGSWTPEAAAEHPEAIEQLGIEFARAGADITQTFTFWAHDDALPKGCKFTCAEINQAACDTAKKVARERGTIVAGGITQTGTFNPGSSVKSKVQTELRKALEVLILNKVDLIICEYFRNILEMEWAIEVALEYGIPAAATMCIGPVGDESGVGVGECAVRMAKAGALLVGVNCLFDPFICLEVLKTMKEALVGLRSLSFPLALNPGRSRVGKLESGLDKLLNLACATSEVVVALNLTTSGLWLRS